MTTPSHSCCDACDQPFGEDDWIDRHSVSDTEADQHDLHPGEYHVTCCPLCSPPVEVAP